MPRTGSTSGYPFHQDAIRIQAQLQIRSEGNGSQSRRFSVDPSLTDFLILKNLIGRAFDLKGDFVINYRALDDYGTETYLPLVSDWDLGAAFLSASIPDLQLMIEPRNVPVDGSEEYDDVPSWELIKSAAVMNPSPLPIANHHRRTQENSCGRANTAGTNNKIYMSPAHFNPKINTAGIFNTMERWVQKALTFVEDISVVTTRPPLSDVEFRRYLDQTGILLYPRELRFACFHGGVEASLRKVVWKHLLNVYPEGLTGNGRIDYIRKKAKEYFDLRDSWRVALQHGEMVSEELLCVTNMVKKDVLRTDRQHKYFAGQDDNQNIGSLFNILTTYALNHPSVSYCQGMSDLASPLLVTMGDEAQAYICFCSLMERLHPNFNSDGLAMSLKFAHLSEALSHCDAEFWSYLKSVGADDLLFCYRWLLLELKREFVFEDALRMMEVLWSSLPYKPQDVPLYEVKYTGSDTQSVPIPVPSLTSSYSKVCAIRRSSSTITSTDVRNRRYSRNKQKSGPHLSLDENSLTSLSSTSSSGMASVSQGKPFHSLDDDTMEILSCSDFPPGTSPFEILNLGDLDNITLENQKPKLIKNLKEFWHIGRRNSKPPKNKTSPNEGESNSSSGDSTLSETETTENLCGLNESNGREFLEDYKDSSNNPSSNNFVFSEGKREGLNGVIDNIGESSQAKSITQNLVRNCDLPRGSTTNGSFVEKQKAQNNDSVFTDSENDSGHCCDSIELENSLEEPEFQSGTQEPRNPRFRLPPAEEFGGGNPFMMFLCLTMLLQHRDHIMKNQMDYNETAMYFDKMVRKHNVVRVLAQARQMYSNYLKQTMIPKAASRMDERI